MPYKKKPPSKKRPYKRKRFVRRRRAIIPSAPANHSVVKLKYTENIRLDSILGSLATQLYRINDVYDPNGALGGHQPYFRDQMYTLYKFARVLWAKISVQLMVNNATAPCYFVITPCQNYSMDSDLQTASERKGSKECNINGSIIKTLVCKSSTDYYFGAKKGSTLLDSGYLQPSNTALSDSFAMWYGLGFKCLDSANGGLSCYCKVDIEMITRFEEPLQQSGS